MPANILILVENDIIMELGHRHLSSDTNKLQAEFHVDRMMSWG